MVVDNFPAHVIVIMIWLANGNDSNMATYTFLYELFKSKKKLIDSFDIPLEVMGNLVGIWIPIAFCINFNWMNMQTCCCIALAAIAIKRFFRFNLCICQKEAHRLLFDAKFVEWALSSTKTTPVIKSFNRRKYALRQKSMRYATIHNRKSFQHN